MKLYLPQAADVANAADVLTAEADIPAFERGDKSILIVEDDALVREYVVTQIESLGYGTLAASNATEAMAIINGPERIDLLFTDVIIPGGMNGRQLATEALVLRPGLKVLYTSGYTENAIVHHGRLDIGVLLLPKPYLQLRSRANDPDRADGLNSASRMGMKPTGRKCRGGMGRSPVVPESRGYLIRPPEDADPAVARSASSDITAERPAGRRRACVVGGNLNDLNRRPGGGCLSLEMVWICQRSVLMARPCCGRRN